MFDKLLNRSSLERKIGAMSIARSITIFSALIVAMILTRILPESYYGLYRKLWLVFALLGPSLISSAVGTLYYRNELAKNRTIAVYSAIFQACAYGLMMAAIAYLGAPYFVRFFHAGNLAIPLKMFSVYMGLATFAGLSEPIFVVLNRKKWLLSYSLAFSILDAVLIVVPFYLSVPLQQIVLIMAAGPLLRTLFIISLSAIQLHDPFNWEDLKQELGTGFYYGVGLFVVAIAGMASVEVDKWIVGNYYTSDLMYAIYAIGARKIPFLSAITASISSSLIVHYSAEIRNNNFDGILRAARGATDKLFLLILPLLAWLFIFAREVMVILFQKYAASAPIFRIYLLIIITHFFFAQSVLLGRGMSRINAWIGVAEVFINIILSFVLIRFWGLIGPALATLMAHWIFQLLIMSYCRQKYSIPIHRFMPTYRIWPLLISLPAIIGISILMKRWILNSFMAFLISGVITMILIGFQMVLLSKKTDDIVSA